MLLISVGAVRSRRVAPAPFPFAEGEPGFARFRGILIPAASAVGFSATHPAGGARRLVEQQSEQRARRVPQQQPSNESQQQYRLSGGSRRAIMTVILQMPAVYGWLDRMDHDRLPPEASPF